MKYCTALAAIFTAASASTIVSDALSGCYTDSNNPLAWRYLNFGRDWMLVQGTCQGSDTGPIKWELDASASNIEVPMVVFIDFNPIGGPTGDYDNGKSHGFWDEPKQA